ncbi:MAG TPA: hypothetical protein VGL00_12355 [Terracidiphilus sp.]
MFFHSFRPAVALAGILLTTIAVPAQSSSSAPLPDIPRLMQEVMDHQKKIEKVRESYTYSSTQTVQDVDGDGKVTKTETTETENFFVNGHSIERTVKKNGKPLDAHEEQKETERVTKRVEKAEKTPAGQPLQGQAVSIRRVLELMDIKNTRREMYRGRPAIVFDFVGRKNAKTHGIAEDASKKLQGTMWVDEADREVAHLDVSFTDNFHIAGGLVANVQKGSNVHFDQKPVEADLWLPTAAEGNFQVRVLLVKNMRQRFSERDYDYKVFRVDAQQARDAKVVSGEKR